MTEPVERIGHGERQQAVEALKTHYAQGRLTSQEYEDRSLSAQQARTWSDVHSLFADLPEPHPLPGAAITPLASPGDPVPQPAGATRVTSQSGQGGLLPEPYAAYVMALVPLVAVVLFFVTTTWLWFLAIPIAGVLIYGPGGKHGHRDRDRNRRRLDP